MVLTKSSVSGVLQWLRRLYGHSKPQRISPVSPDVTNERLPDGCQANSNRRELYWPPSSSKSPGAIKRRAF